MALHIVTNNPMVYEAFQECWPVQYEEGQSYTALLISVRDQIHRGAVLLTHPLSGSIKPGETPYKSVLVDAASGNMDLKSLELIEETLRVATRMVAQAGDRRWTEKILKDFQLIDCDLIRFALDHASQSYSNAYTGGKL